MLTRIRQTQKNGYLRYSVVVVIKESTPPKLNGEIFKKRKRKIRKSG